MSRPLTLTRDLVRKLPDRVDERAPPDGYEYPDTYYQDAASDVLRDPRARDTLWIFAIGSLIWNPRCDVAERRTALVRGWRRSFCLGPDERFRGSPSAPGRMLSLDRGGSCKGVVLRMHAADRHGDLFALLKLEPPIPPVWVTAETDLGPVPAISFVTPRSFRRYVPEGDLEALADILSTAVGHIGSMADYLLNTVTELEKAGIHDPHLWRLQQMVAERLARL